MTKAKSRSLSELNLADPFAPGAATTAPAATTVAVAAPRTVTLPNTPPQLSGSGANLGVGGATAIRIALKYYRQVQVGKLYSFAVEVSPPAGYVALDPLTIQLHIPGMLVTPSEQMVSIGREPTLAVFGVVPLAAGQATGAHVAVLRPSQEPQNIPINVRASNPGGRSWLQLAWLLPALLALITVGLATPAGAASGPLADILKGPSPLLPPVFAGVAGSAQAAVDWLALKGVAWPLGVYLVLGCLGMAGLMAWRSGAKYTSQVGTLIVAAAAATAAARPRTLPDYLKPVSEDEIGELPRR
jgi:hypothetical protein